MPANRRRCAKPLHPAQGVGMGAALRAALRPDLPPVVQAVVLAAKRAVSGVVAGVALGAATAAPAHATAAVGCLITPLRSADIGTPVAGVVDTMAVERGDAVHRGQLLFTLRADVENANTAAAELRARNEAGVLGAEASLRASYKKYQRTRQLQEQGFVALPALEQARTDYELAEQQWRQAHAQRDNLRAEVAPTRAQASQRVVRAPFDGVVIDRLAQPGERVELQPLLRLADVQRLKLEVIVPAAHFGAVRVGQMVEFRPEVPGAAQHRAAITKVDNFIDAASNTFRVRAELNNAAGRVPAGARCKVNLGALDTAANAAAHPREATAARPASPAPSAPARPAPRVPPPPTAPH